MAIFMEIEDKLRLEISALTGHPSGPFNWLLYCIYQRACMSAWVHGVHTPGVCMCHGLHATHGFSRLLGCVFCWLSGG